MKIIVRDTLEKLAIKNQHNPTQKSKKSSAKVSFDKQQIESLIEQHQFYIPELSKDQIFKQVIKQYESSIKKDSSQSKVQQALDRLSLYLKKQTNQQLFSVLQFIIKNPQGVSYAQIAEAFKIDIINASHFCCKLKKMKFIGWQHYKDGLLVFPYQRKQQDREEQQLQPTENINKNPFCFAQLSLLPNIWLNVSKAETYLSASGISNQEIKNKVLKNSETKMLRRSVQYFDKDFEKIAQRQGKVYEFKYKNSTQRLKDQIEKKKNQNPQRQQIQALDTIVQQWIRQKFPEYTGETFLLDLINDNMKEYVSSLGVKHSKRQCTPLKLSRYIKILNYLNSYGGLTQPQLRKFLVQVEKNLNIGTMHKRSLLGILDGLAKLQIIKQEQETYYPCWQSSNVKRRSIEEQQKQNPKRKKIKLNQQQVKGAKNARQSKIILQGTQITQKKHKLQLFATLLQYQLQVIVKRIMKRAFHSLKKVNRKKQQACIFKPNKHILGILSLNDQQNRKSLPAIQSRDFHQLMQELDTFIEKQGKIESQFDISVPYDTIKFLRKFSICKYDTLKRKFGKSWKQKFEVLQKQGKVIFDDLLSEMRLNLNSNEFLL